MNPITRRDFLKASGSLVVSVSIPGAIATAMSQGISSSAVLGGKPPLMPDQLDSWIAVLPDLAIDPRAFSTTLAKPPRLFPGVGLALRSADPRAR